LAPIIADFIRNTQKELYDEKLEDVLEMLDLEWSKDEDTRTQCNQLNTGPIQKARKFQPEGQITAGDGSHRKGKIGAGYNNLRRRKKRQKCKVGQEKEGSSSNRPQLSAFSLALCDTLIEEPMLHVCDNQSLLEAVNRWIGEGGKATLVGAPDADILLAAIEILRKRIAAGTATFVVKVKAHRGEPTNERADFLADKAISDPKVGIEWCQRTK